MLSLTRPEQRRQRELRATSPLGTKSLPQKYFVSPEMFDAEQETLFSKNCLLLGHQSQIAR
jgi:hypothetical protein